MANWIRRLRAASVVLVLLGPAGPLTGQAPVQVPPNRGGFTTSMGLPPSWRWSLGGSVSTHRRDAKDIAVYLNGGVYRDLLSPVTSALGVLTEGYFGQRGNFSGPGNGADGGLRMTLYSPVLRFAGGVDYSFPDGEADFLLSLIHPIQRGGLFTHGGSLRIDYLPGRSHTTGIGLHFPIGQRWVGTTRPRYDHVVLRSPEPPVIPFSPSPSQREALGHAGDLALAIDRFVVPFTDQWNGNKDKALDLFVEEAAGIRDYLRSDAAPFYEGPRTAAGDISAFHDALDRAFSEAVEGRPFQLGESSALGVRVAAMAREIVLTEVLVPYNSLLGQKRKPDTTHGLAAAASAAFYEWLSVETPVRGSQVEATAWTLSEYLTLVDRIRQINRDQWGDGRFVWLPLQLALRADQHDDQDELNRLVERLTGVEFVEASPVSYVENEQFQVELGNMIREARDYHVIWVHDFRGYNADGDPDEIAFRQVTEAYLPALIAAVRRYDHTGKIPQYIQIFDQFYFHANKGVLWTDLLEQPMSHEISLPRGFEAWEDSIASLQAQLREAVASSQLMQGQAVLFGDRWIENLVKVHLNVTHPPDPSFWTSEIFPFMGTADVVMRDHRKISFFDVSEDDPYRGRAIYTGMGVGEHYSGAGWEDRAVMARGPVLLQLRNSARRLLLNQGFAEREIPWELQPKPFASDYADHIAEYQARVGGGSLALQVHNEVGYHAKRVSVLKATLYTLMPPGSVIKAPDSIWGSQLWGSMMLGHALRGGRSLVIAPAIANAPSAGWPQMSRAQETLTRLVVASELLGPEIERDGGLLKVGLYSTQLDVRDIPGKISALLTTLDETPWLEELYGFAPTVLRGLAEEADALRTEGFVPSDSAAVGSPTAKLHMKAHAYFSREAWTQILSSPGLEPLLRGHYQELTAANRALATGDQRDNLGRYSEHVRPLAITVVQAVSERLTPRERARLVMFLAVGSHNQNNRSFALDGEVALVNAGWASVAGLLDLITLVGLCDWIDDTAELERLFPGYDGLARRISRFIRIGV